MDKNDAAFVGSIPEFYDRGLGPVIFVDFATQMAERVAKASPSAVIETAAGTGFVTRALRDRLPPATRITATDLNPPMLDIARGKFGADQNIQFQTADAQDLDFPDASFDAIVCQFGIMFYPDLAKSFGEALRVLRPGGHYHFSVWDSHRYNGFARIVHGLVQKTFPDNPPGFYTVPFSRADIDPLRHMLAEKGFTDINVTVSTLNKSVDDLALFARGLIYGNPLIDQLRARDQVDPEAMHAELVILLESEFGTNPSVVPLQTIFYRASKPA